MTTSSVLDYEADATFMVLLRVEDGGVPALSTTVTLAVTVQGQDRADCTVKNNIYNARTEIGGYSVTW